MKVFYYCGGLCRVMSALNVLFALGLLFLMGLVVWLGVRAINNGEDDGIMREDVGRDYYQHGDDFGGEEEGDEEREDSGGVSDVVLNSGVDFEVGDKVVLCGSCGCVNKPGFAYCCNCVSGLRAAREGVVTRVRE